MRFIDFSGIPSDNWNDWHWQVSNRVTTLDDLIKVGVELTDDEFKCLESTLGRLRMAITPYYLSLIDLDDPFDPIRKQAIPTEDELHFADYEASDPLGEDEYSPCKGLTHRYPDRVLLLVTDQCSMYCRHCTRRRFTGNCDGIVPTEQISAGIEYIKNHKEIRDVLVSGGDPLMLEDDVLEWIFSELSKIDHVEVVRFGTRVPCVSTKNNT